MAAAGADRHRHPCLALAGARMVRAMGGVRTRPGAARCGHLRPAARHLPAARCSSTRRGSACVFLAVFPIVMAAFVLGRTAAVVVAAHRHRALGRRADHQSGHRHQHGRADRRARSGAERSSSGWRCSSRAARARDAGCAWRWRSPSASARELESLRAALTAPELPALDGLTVATSYTPAEGLVAGDFFLVTRGAQDSTLVVRGRRRRPRPGRRAPRVVRARDHRALRRVRRRPDDDPAPGQHGAGRARPGHRVRHRAVREHRARPRRP